MDWIYCARLGTPVKPPSFFVSLSFINIRIAIYMMKKGPAVF